MDIDQENSYRLRMKLHRVLKNFFAICGLILGCFWIFFQQYEGFRIVVLAEWFLPLLSKVELTACEVTILGFYVFKDKRQNEKAFQTLKIISFIITLANIGFFCYVCIANSEQMFSIHRQDFYYVCIQLGTFLSVTGAVVVECSQQKLARIFLEVFGENIRHMLIQQQPNVEYHNPLDDQQAQQRISVESLNHSQLDAVYGNLCSICNEETDPKGKAVQLPCKHIFHPACIRKWLQIKQFCPNCRVAIKADSFIELEE